MFAKIFLQILESSIADNPELRFTFMDMLILANIDGVVDITHEAIARRTNRPLEVIRRTIIELEGPDPRSGTHTLQGARLKRLYDHRDWGWLIINYQHYRELASEEQRRAKTRARVQRHREKIREEDGEEEGESARCVTGALQPKATQRQLLPSLPSDNLPPPLNTPECQDAWDEWQEHYRQRLGFQMTERAAHQLVNQLKEWGPERMIAAIKKSVRSNWKGVHEEKEHGSNGANQKPNRAGNRNAGTANERSKSDYGAFKNPGEK